MCLLNVVIACQTDQKFLKFHTTPDVLGRASVAVTEDDSTVLCCGGINV